MTGSKAGQQAGFPYSLISFIVAFWSVLWAAGFPSPNWDDLFFVGGAFELARTGRLANPLIRFWNPVAADRYFFQPPFYQYALAGWIELFGISARSLLGFQCVVLAVFSVSATFIFRRYGFRGAAAIPIVLAFAMGPQGLRHDAMGLALLALGLWSLSSPGALRTFAGAFLLASSIATWPALLAYAVPLGAASLCVALQPGPSPLARVASRLATALAGAGAAFVLFLVSIRFRLTEFLADFAWHARLRRPTGGEILPALELQLTNGKAELLYGPLYALFFFLTAVMAVRWRQTRLEARVFLCALWAGILANLVLYASILHVLADLFCWIGVVVLLNEIPVSRGVRRLSTAAAVIAFTIAQSYPLVALAGRQSVTPARYAEIRTVLQTRAVRAIAADEVAARFVFDYRLPPGAFFWNYSVPPPKTCPASVLEKAPGVTWVLSPVKSNTTKGLPAAGKVRLFGRELGSIPAKPYEVVIE